ncbi:MAG: HAD-IA family hydrolase [Verrucomicrobiota bacterium]
MSFAGVIFDMDGVLCDSEDFMAEAAVAMFSEAYGVTVRPDEFRPFRGMGEDRYLGGVGKNHGVTLDLPAAKNRAYEIFLQRIPGRLKSLPGAQEFIASCRARGLKLALATSADRMKLNGMLPEIGLPHRLFDAIVTGSDVANKKPNPEIFLTAARLIGLLAASCLVVEDAASGVQAAKAAGSRCLALTTSLDAATLRGLNADWVAVDLAHVPAEIWEN